MTTKTEPSAEATALIDVMERTLATLLVAPESLFERVAHTADAPSTRAAGDLLFIQGRGDRLHAILACGASELDQTVLLDRFAEAGANWVWLAVEPDHAALATAAAGGRKLGVLTVTNERVEKALQAPPRPGIFIKAYLELRKRWRQIASW